jgi:hypothetical protein
MVDASWNFKGTYQYIIEYPVIPGHSTENHEFGPIFLLLRKPGMTGY